MELPQGVLRRNRNHLRKSNEPAATTNDTRPEQCNKPKPVEPVTETYELLSQSSVEVPPEVPPPAAPVLSQGLSASAETPTF